MLVIQQDYYILFCQITWSVLSRFAPCVTIPFKLSLGFSFFLKKLTLSQQGHNKLSKKTFIMLQKIISSKYCSFELCIYQRILKKCIMVSIQVLCSKNISTFIIIRMFLVHQFSILEWFLNDCVTLKTGVMMLKIQLYHHRNKLHFKIY